MNKRDWELEDHLFITQLVPVPDHKDLWATATISQGLVEEVYHSIKAQVASSLISDYARV